MRSPHRGVLFPTLLVAASILAGHPVRGATPVLDAMKEELQRSVETLSKQPTPLYYLSYEVTGNRRYSVRASFGNVIGSSEAENAVVDVDLRVGSPELDNTHPIRGDRLANFPRYAYQQAPLGDPEALRSILWRRTDQQYKAAVERLAKVRANVQVKVEEEDQAGGLFGGTRSEVAGGAATSGFRPVSLGGEAAQVHGSFYRLRPHLLCRRHAVGKRGDSLVREQRRQPDSDLPILLPPDDHGLHQGRGRDGAAALRVLLLLHCRGAPGRQRGLGDRRGNDCRSQGPAGGPPGGSLYRSGHPLRPGQRRVLP